MIGETLHYGFGTQWNVLGLKGNIVKAALSHRALNILFDSLIKPNPALWLSSLMPPLKNHEMPFNNI